MASVKEPSGEPIWSVVAFWLVALAAAALFAAVLIAPRWEQSEMLRERVRLLATHCHYLNQANKQLTRSIEALKHDPDFTLEVARCELDYSLPGEHRIPAPSRNWQCRKPPSLEREPTAWWHPVLRAFARDTLLRQSALLTAAVFTVVGLAFFNPSSEMTEGTD